jgi:hypothetical protein
MVRPLWPPVYYGTRGLWFPLHEGSVLPEAEAHPLEASLAEERHSRSTSGGSLVILLIANAIPSGSV